MSAPKLTATGQALVNAEHCRGLRQSQHWQWFQERQRTKLDALAREILESAPIDGAAMEALARKITEYRTLKAAVFTEVEQIEAGAHATIKNASPDGEDIPGRIE